MGRKWKILGLPGDKKPNAACEMYRVRWPLNAIERTGFATTYIPPLEGGDRIVGIYQDGHKSPNELNIINNYDLLVFQRQPDNDIGKLLLICKKVGVKTVFDIDDDALHIPRHNPNYMVWGMDRRHIRNMIIAYRKVGYNPDAIKHLTPEDAAKQAQELRNGLLNNLRIADAVTVTTPALQQVYQKYNSNIHVLPNQMDLAGWQNLEGVRHDGELWITWAGGWSHERDLKLVVRPIQEILRRYKHVNFCIIGFTQAKQFVFGDLPEDRVITFPWSDDVFGYRNHLASADIVIAPSEKISFNEGKSDIRLMEAWLAAKCPVVASPTTYGHTVNVSGGGLIAKKPKDWLRTLSRLIEQPDLRGQLGRAGYEYVTKNRTYDNQVSRWIEVYQSLLE